MLELLLLFIALLVIAIGYIVYAVNTGKRPSAQQKSDDERGLTKGRQNQHNRAGIASTPTTPTATVAAIPKAVSLDQIIDNAKGKMNLQSTSEELKNVKAELLKIRPSSRRYPEVQQMLHRIDQYIDTATKAERRAASNWRYSEQNDEMGRGTDL